MEANFLNSSDSIDAVKDKLLYTLGLSAANLPIPKTILDRSSINIDYVEEFLGFPVINFEW